MFDSCVLDAESIKRGLDQAVSSDSPYPPSCGQFISWCIGDAVSHGKAWSEICQKPRRYSSGLVWAAATDQRVDLFNWRLLPIEKGARLFKPIFDEYAKRERSGEVFVQPEQLDAPKSESRPRTEQEKQKGLDILEQLKSSLS